jgi:hypothetical protein
MPGVPDQAVTELETAVATFRQRLVPTTIDDAVDAAVTKFRQKFQADGIDVIPADVLNARGARTYGGKNGASDR